MADDQHASPTADSGGRLRGVVSLGEDHDPGGWCTGTVSGSWAEDEDNDHIETEALPPTTVDEAIAWGRARAELVFLQIGDDTYFVGDGPNPGDEDDDPDEGELLAWPEGGLVLHPRFEYEPAGVPRATAWWVRLTRSRDATEAAGDLARVLEADDRVLATRVVDDRVPVAIDLLIAATDGTPADRGLARADIVALRATIRAVHHLGLERGETPTTPTARETHWAAPEPGHTVQVEILGPR